MTSKTKRPSSCVSCGYPITEGEDSCPQCGKPVKKRAGKSRNTRQSVPRKKRLCPSCGSEISSRAKKCPQCGAPISKAESEPKDLPIDREISTPETGPGKEELPEPPNQNDRPSCPICSWPLEGTEPSCPQCGTPISASAVKSEPVALQEPAPEEKPTVEPVPSPAEETRPCPTCGSTVPLSLQNCPICNSSLAEPSPKTEVIEQSPSAEAAQTTVTGPHAAPQETELTPKPATAKRTRTRRLKTTGAVAPVPALTRAPGLTNGVGQQIRTAKTSDRGAVNGTGIVNGNALSVGSAALTMGGSTKAAGARRRSLLLRWQFLVVLLAILIVIPVFMSLSYTSKESGYAIDGDFSDWKGATFYGTMLSSGTPSTNITEWSVATESSNLYLYFETEAQMMSDADAESFYLFVDSDGSNSTGYVLEDIGADYLLTLSGWDSAVNTTSLQQYKSASDQYNWNGWVAIGSLAYSLDGTRIEAKAIMPEEIGQTAKFVLLSKDQINQGSVSYQAPLKGGVLIVRQVPAADVVASGTISKSAGVTILTLEATCQGSSGEVTSISPTLSGALLTNQIAEFSLQTGEVQKVSIVVDTSKASNGQLVSAEVVASSIVSTFGSVQIIGSGVRAYVEVPPSAIEIDGAFADWTVGMSVDQDMTPVSDPNLDINEVGAANASLASYFYVSVKGEICSGTFVPALVTKPLKTGGGGGVVVPTRRTAEDVLSIYVDSDLSNSTGYPVALNEKHIGADMKIEIRGLFGKITSMKEYSYSSSGDWAVGDVQLDAANDGQRMEISASGAGLGAAGEIDFIVETTSWAGRMDLATFDDSAAKTFARNWIVEPVTTSSTATSTSNQRKLFFDGTNYWSFYFDGTDTVYRCSSDGGITWSIPVRVFITSGVDKVSVWYDSPSGLVYAVGDVGVATRTVFVQRGVVDPAAGTIAWNSSDAPLTVSLLNLSNKNTFISKDDSGYLWVLASNSTGIIPIRQDLSVFKSAATDNITSWERTGNLVATGNNVPDCKGSILPSGNGSEVWAIYAYSGNVASRKYTTSWSSENLIYAIGGLNPGNTENAPPSAIVDSDGVVHVVYGTGRKSGGYSTPLIEYSRNNSGQLTFTPGLNLDPTISSGIGDYYPTITLDTSTGSLYVLWLQGDKTYAPKTIMGRVCASGVWSVLTIDEQTSFTKQFLTSAYSVPDKSLLSWQWTQNTTAPIEVWFDAPAIPEFGDIAPIVIVTAGMLAVIVRRSRRIKEGQN